MDRITMNNSNMLPSKNTLDYLLEINRLFPRQSEDELHTPTSLYRQEINSMPNHSSSSADSLSPEVFPNVSPSHTMDFRGARNFSDTPFNNRRQRPIVGRKILGNRELPNYETIQVSPVQSIESDTEFRAAWQESHFSGTPPNRKTLLDHKGCIQSAYELFPAENRDFEFRTPIKNSPKSSMNYSINISPSSSAMSVSPISSKFMNSFPTPLPPYRRNITSTFTPWPSRMGQDTNNGKLCTFCRKNGETPTVYMNHTVKEVKGNRNIVTCPILRSHVCSTCGASGDDAHTITYCPVLRSNNDGRPLQSTTITLKNTRIKSNGRKRY